MGPGTQAAEGIRSSAGVRCGVACGVDGALRGCQREPGRVAVWQGAPPAVP